MLSLRDVESEKLQSKAAWVSLGSPCGNPRRDAT